jgi:orotidine-5'-phosphate decarboxylase
MHFTRKLKQALRETKSHLIVGLDTDIKQIPQFFLAAANPIAEFNNLVIEATKDFVCGYKINTAFYERAAEIGWTSLRSAVEIIPDNLITIADAKRGDIENTSEFYAQAFFDELGFDAITIQPYMGSDSVRPFIRRKNKFVFLLVLTSNYGANDFQFLKTGQRMLYEVVMEKAFEWNDHKIGFVVGANHDRELAKITKKYHETPILIPGIGVQKGSLEKTIKALYHGLFLINQSRSIIYSAPKAENATEFVKIISEKAMHSRDEINRLMESVT